MAERLPVLSLIGGQNVVVSAKSAGLNIHNNLGVLDFPKLNISDLKHIRRF